MRKNTAPVALLSLLAIAAPARAEDPAALAFKIIKERRLLTPKQQMCVSLLEREDSDKKIAKFGVIEKHDKVCGGDPEVAPRLFDLEIDMKTGAAKWDNNPDGEMRPIPKRR